MRTLPTVAGETVDDVIGRVAARLNWRWLVWLVPFAVLFAMLHFSTSRIIDLTGGILALGALTWAVRRPGRALIAVVVFLPLQTVGFGFLLRLHVPTRVLRLGGGLKELLAVGILISALHALHIGRVRLGKEHQLDAIDKALLAYVGMVTVYLLVPRLFTTFPVSNHLTVRLLAWRADCGYVLLFFGVRHAPLSDSTRRTFIRVIIALGGLTIALGMYQLLEPRSWSHLILVTGGQVKYQTSVLGNDPTTVARDLSYLTTFKSLRISSIFLSPFDMADFLLILLAIAVERVARDYRSWGTYLLCGTILTALYASRVRADALAAIVIAVIALIPTPNRPVAARLRLLGALLVGAAVIIPLLAGTRFVNAEGGAKSSRDHITEITGGLRVLARDPMGLGIGNAAGVGDRFLLAANRQGAFTVDNTVLQVGDELGIQSLVPWIVMMLLVWGALGRAARRSDPFAGGVRLAFLAVFIAGMYHQVFLTFPVPWILWAAVALALRNVTVPALQDQDSVILASNTPGNIEEIDATAAGEPA